MRLALPPPSTLLIAGPETLQPSVHGVGATKGDTDDVNGSNPSRSEGSDDVRVIKGLAWTCDAPQCEGALNCRQDTFERVATPGGSL